MTRRASSSARPKQQHMHRLSWRRWTSPIHYIELVLRVSAACWVYVRPERKRVLLVWKILQRVECVFDCSLGHGASTRRVVENILLLYIHGAHGASTRRVVEIILLLYIHGAHGASTRRVVEIILLLYIHGAHGASTRRVVEIILLLYIHGAHGASTPPGCGDYFVTIYPRRTRSEYPPGCGDYFVTIYPRRTRSEYPPCCGDYFVTIYPRRTRSEYPPGCGDYFVTIYPRQRRENPLPYPQHPSYKIIFSTTHVVQQVSFCVGDNTDTAHCVCSRWRLIPCRAKTDTTRRGQPHGWDGPLREQTSNRRYKSARRQQNKVQKRHKEAQTQCALHTVASS